MRGDDSEEGHGEKVMKSQVLNIIVQSIQQGIRTEFRQDPIISFNNQTIILPNKTCLLIIAKDPPIPPFLGRGLEHDIEVGVEIVIGEGGERPILCEMETYRSSAVNQTIQRISFWDHTEIDLRAVICVQTPNPDIPRRTLPRIQLAPRRSTQSIPEGISYRLFTRRTNRLHLLIPLVLVERDSKTVEILLE